MADKKDPGLVDPQGNPISSTEKQIALNKEQIKQRNTLLGIERDIKKLAERHLEIDTTLDRNLKDRHKAYLDIYDIETQDLLKAKERYELEKASLEGYKDKLAQLEKEEILLKSMADINEEDLKTLLFRKNALEGVVGFLEDSVKASRETAQHSEALEKRLQAIQGHAQFWAQSMFGITERSREIGKYFLDTNNNVKVLNGSIKLFRQHLVASVDKAGAIGSALEKAYETFGAMKDQAMTWAKGLATGPAEATQKFATETRLMAQELGYDMEQMNSELIERTNRVSQGLIITSAEAQKSYMTMIKGSTQFRRVSDEEAIAFTRSATLLERWGVDAKTSGAIWDKLQVTYGKTAEQATRMVGAVTDVARVLKLDANQIAVEYEQNLDQLARHALPATLKEFGKLKAMSMATNTNVGKLMSTMDKWSTFEGAATAAQTLNAVFDKLNLSSVEMHRIQTTEGPGAAMMYLKERFDLAGVSISDFDNGPMKDLLGDMMGGGDAATGMNILGASTEEMKKAIEEAGGAMASYTDIEQKLNKVGKETQTTQQTEAKMIDKTRTEIQHLGDEFYELKNTVNEWLASSPWAALTIGLVAMTGTGIASLIALWWSWAGSSIMAANAVAAATQRAASVPGGPLGGPGGMGGGRVPAPKRLQYPAGTVVDGRKVGGQFATQAQLNAATASRGGRFGRFMKGSGGRVSAGLGGSALLYGANQFDEGSAGDVGMSAAGYTALGFSVAGVPGAIVGGVGSLTKDAIDYRLQGKSQGPSELEGGTGKVFWGEGGVPTFHDGGTIPEDARMISKTTGKAVGDVEGGETIVPKAATSAPAQVTINLVLQDGTLIKSTQAAVDLLAPEIFAKCTI